MKKRISVSKLEPKSYEPLVATEKYLENSDLDYLLRELIKIRVSQINHCAYCLDMHTRDARAAGESEKKLHLVAAWHESPLFSAAERAALALAEEITHISVKGVSDETYEEVRAHYSDNQVAQLIILICQINTWNRIAVSTHMLHPM